MYYDINGDLQTTGNFTTKLKELSIWNNLKSNGTYTPDGANTEEALEEYELDGYRYYVNEKFQEPYVREEVSNVAKNLVFGEQENKYYYWLASRGVCANPDYATFGPGTVGDGGAYSSFDLFYSGGRSFAYSISVRPVVSLKSEIPAGGDILLSDVGWGGVD